jgi:hypothetical protein
MVASYAYRQIQIAARNVSNSKSECRIRDLLGIILDDHFSIRYPIRIYRWRRGIAYYVYPENEIIYLDR